MEDIVISGFSGEKPVIVYKTADETQASATLQNDDHLFFSVEANKKYAWQLFALYTVGNTSTSHNYAFTGPASPNNVRYGVLDDKGSTGTRAAATAFGTSRPWANNLVNTSAMSIISIHGQRRSASARELKLNCSSIRITPHLVGDSIMPWVERDGVNNQLMPGIAEEFLDETNQEFKEFIEKTKNASLSLADYKTVKIKDINAQIGAYVFSRYQPHRQDTLAFLHQIGGTNRKAYIQTVWDWMDTVFDYYYTLEDAVVAAADHDAVRAVQVSQSQLDTFTAADPLKTIREAKNIVD